jgi:hypothetical protein
LDFQWLVSSPLGDQRKPAGGIVAYEKIILDALDMKTFSLASGSDKLAMGLHVCWSA